MDVPCPIMTSEKTRTVHYYPVPVLNVGSSSAETNKEILLNNFTQVLLNNKFSGSV